MVRFSSRYPTYEDWLNNQPYTRRRSSNFYRVRNGHVRDPSATLEQLTGKEKKKKKKKVIRNYYHCYVLGFETHGEKQGDISFDLWLETVVNKKDVLPSDKNIYDLMIKWLGAKYPRKNVLRMQEDEDKKLLRSRRDLRLLAKDVFRFVKILKVEVEPTERQRSFSKGVISLFRFMWETFFTGEVKKLDEGFEIVDSEEIDILLEVKKLEN